MAATAIDNRLVFSDCDDDGIEVITREELETDEESAKVEPSKPPMEVNHEKGNSPFVASAGTKAMLEGETLQGSPPVAPYEKLTFIGENLDGDSEYDSADVDELHKLLSIERTTLRSNNVVNMANEKMKDAISRFKRDVSGSEDAAMITSDDLGGTDHVTAADTFNTEDAAGAGTNMETRNITSANSDNVDNQDQEVDLSTSQSNNNSANSSPNPRKYFNLPRRRLQKLNKQGGSDGGHSLQRESLPARIRSRYNSMNIGQVIMMACILSFLTAFILLSLYSALTHHYELKFFQLKEKHSADQLAIFERSQIREQNFRESLIHQQYEEARECRSTLNSCHSGKDEFMARIASLQTDATRARTACEAKLESQRIEIAELGSKIQRLQQTNKELRAELGQSFTATLAKILLRAKNMIKNKTVQVFAAGVSAIFFFLFVISSAFSK